MAGEQESKGGGLFRGLKTLFDRNRLGELLVSRGVLTPQQLRQALALQKGEADQLGRVLVRNGLIRRRDLYTALTQQVAMRCLVGTAAFFLTFAAPGIKPANAGVSKDIPAQIKLASTANSAFAPPPHYAALFGASEQASTNLDAFTKWTGMFRRFEAAMNDAQGQKIVREWKENLESMQGLSLEAMARSVNDLINRTEYINDSRNWGKSDYWQTPVEFFTRGGDCEDFAIAKYASLRALGVPEDRLRITILQDTQKGIPHAVLALYTDDDVLILDNQIKNVRSSSSIGHYKPIFSINRHAWWLHTKGGSTIVASAAE